MGAPLQQPETTAAISAPVLSHWKISFGSSGHCWVTFDKAESSSNTLSSDAVEELERLIGYLEQQRNLPGIVIRSAKTSGFILGADVGEFETLDDPVAAAGLAARGQQLFQRIEDLPCPTVALLNGYTLGGGLELALACRYRIAIESFERCIGLPEVQLGIHPGFGGTVRSVALLGVPRALDLMLTGRLLSPVEARAAGLIDGLAPPGEGEAAAIRMLSRKPPPRRAAWYLRLLNTKMLRPLLARRMREATRRKARPEHYPAPYALIDLWERYGGEGNDAYRAEAESIGRLLVSATSRNLVRVFRLRERLRNLVPRGDSVRHVHVVGAGVMGGDIASWCALNGIAVTLQDREEKFVTPALERARALFGKRLKAPGAAAAARKRLVADVPGNGRARADIVIEAIIENLDAKRDLFTGLEQAARADTVLATNTSSIRLEEIATGLRHPDRLVGIHFFNPVASMPLVEVIRKDNTDAEAFRKALGFVTQIGKLPLPCASSPGFLVNRILMPYMLEALAAYEDGYWVETIDAAALKFGMPMGPIELGDRVGLDIALHVAEILTDTYRTEPPKVLRDMVADGRLGQKSPAGGFYRYQDSRALRRKGFPEPDSELIDRLILKLVNEAATCVREGIVDDSDLLDAGVIFGTGFAPHTGGPINYARQCGIDQITERLLQLKAKHGDRFTPSAGWAQIRATA